MSYLYCYSPDYFWGLRAILSKCCKKKLQQKPHNKTALAFKIVKVALSLLEYNILALFAFGYILKMASGISQELGALDTEDSYLVASSIFANIFTVILCVFLIRLFMYGTPDDRGFDAALEDEHLIWQLQVHHNGKDHATNHLLESNHCCCHAYQSG